MRKQTAELHRYRRLSRSGRLSIAPGTSSRAVSGLTTLSELEPDGPSSLFNPSPSSPTGSDFSLGLSPLDSDDESSLLTDDDPLSPAAQAAHDARHRRRDEARLLLDLSKHQELLIDSQKMNQSIKRCLGWTEELIKEGKKALEYHVKVSDVELGGRVLVPEEVDVNGDSREGEEPISGGRLLSPSVEVGSVSWSGKILDEAGSGELREGTRTFDPVDVNAESERRSSTRESSPFLSAPTGEDSPKSPASLGETW
jgi:hypothetical protein